MRGECRLKRGGRYLGEITTAGGEKCDGSPAYATGAVQNRKTWQFDGRVLGNPP